MSRKQKKDKNKTQQHLRHANKAVNWDLIWKVLASIFAFASSLGTVYDLVGKIRSDTQTFYSFIIPGLVFIVWVIILVQLIRKKNPYVILLLAVTVLGGVVGGIAWQSYNQVQNDKLIVLVARFDGPEETYGLRDQIIEQLRASLQAYGDTEIIVANEEVTVAQGSEFARKLGGKNRADLVIWAWYRPIDNPNITIHIENLNPKITTIEATNIFTPEATLRDLESFEIQKELGSSTSSLIVFLTGYLRYEVGDFRVALERFGDALRENNKNFFIPSDIILIFTGASHFSLSNDDLAITDFSKAIELNPDSDAAYNNRGFVFFTRGEYEKAISDYTQAIVLNPNSGAAYGNRGIVYSILRQQENAVEDYTHAIQLEPDYAVYYNNRGMAYQALGQFEMAISDYTRAIEIDSNYAAPYNNRGYAYQTLGEFEKAVRDYSSAIRIRPDDALLYDGRGIAYGSLGQYDKAISDISYAIKLSPNNPKLYNDRGTGYGYLHQYEKAISDYTHAIKLDSNYADAYRNRGIMLQNLGKSADVEADFKKYEELTGEKP